MRSDARPTPHSELINFEVRALVAGSRGYNDYRFFSACMFEYVEKFGNKKIVFISGKARSGADDMIIRWCKENGYPWSEFPADWDDISKPNAVIRYRNGKPYNARAGHDRNEDMGNVATHLLTYYDGQSPGTRHMIAFASKKMGKDKVTTILIDIVKEDTHGRE